MDQQTKTNRAYLILDEIERLASDWPLPEGHVLKIDRSYETRWAMGYPSRSVSIYVGREVPDPNDPDQVHIEVRFFLDEHRATVFAEYGRRWFGKFRPLLTQPSDIHVRGSSFAELAYEVSSSVRYALANAEFNASKVAA